MQGFPPNPFRATSWLPLLCLLLLSAAPRADWHDDEQNIMGTRISARVWHPDAERGRAALEAVMQEMHRINQLYSPYREDSDLSRLNRLAPQASAENPVSVTAEMAHLLNQSRHYSELTGGAFDITYASLGRHYRYREGEQPSAEQRAELLAAIDYRGVHLGSDGAHFERPEIYLDLGGIAKGYAVDRAIALLRERGIEHASVSAGGDTRLLGDRRGRPWSVGIRNPRDRDQVAIRLPLVNEAISTSGDYERYFIDEDGERIHHILNPGTGVPAQGIMSATVLGPTAIDTDALSTSVFVLGVAAGLALIDRLEAFEAILISHDGRVHYSAGLAPPE